MVTLDCVRKGVCSYLDSEIIPKVKGKEKWLIAIGAPMVLDRKVREFGPMLREYGFMDEDGMIDLDRVESSVTEVATKHGSISERIGNVDMTFTVHDVRRMAELIRAHIQ